MGSIELEIVDEIKFYVSIGDLDTIKTLFHEYQHNTEFQREISWDYIFQKVYLHAALKKQKHICEWLDTLFTRLDPIQQIALRQMFSYAKHLLNKD
jgi:hypothetical protein